MKTNHHPLQKETHQHRNRQRTTHQLVTHRRALRSIARERYSGVGCVDAGTTVCECVGSARGRDGGVLEEKMMLAWVVRLCEKEKKNRTIVRVEVDRTKVVVMVVVEAAEQGKIVVVDVGEEAVLVTEGPAAADAAEDAEEDEPDEGEVVDETETGPVLRRGWRR